jgi:hypothetical protein
MTKLLIAYSLAQCLTDRTFVTFGILKALFLAGFTWWLCAFSMWLWNRRFQMRFIHHVFCGFAAVITLMSIFVFQCLGEVKKRALQDLENWRESYSADSTYGWETFLKAHDSLRELYRQNGWQWDANRFVDPPRRLPPDTGRYILPLDHTEGREASLKIYCDRALDNLGLSRPVLSQILWGHATIDLDPMRQDLNAFMQENPGQIYNLTTGSLRIAGELCLEKLGREVAKQVVYLRYELVALFLLAQMIAFGLAGHAAYSALKPSS